MAHRDEIVQYMNDYLCLYAFDDYGPQGLQFIGKDKIKKIACAVSVNVETIFKAAYVGANLLIVHHGLFWYNEPRNVDTRMNLRLDALESQNISLCGYHLALDAHPEVGNNILTCKALGFENIEPFAEIGWGGNITRPDSFYNEIIDLYPGGVIHTFMDNERLDRACVVTGRGGNYIHEAKTQGYDVLITGEAEEQSMHLAKDLKMGLVAAGHSSTEEIGVKALTAKVAEHFDLGWDFIKTDNPV